MTEYKHQTAISQANAGIEHCVFVSQSFLSLKICLTKPVSHSDTFAVMC